MLVHYHDTKHFVSAIQVGLSQYINNCWETYRLNETKRDTTITSNPVTDVKIFIRTTANGGFLFTFISVRVFKLILLSIV